MLPPQLSVSSGCPCSVVARWSSSPKNRAATPQRCKPQSQKVYLSPSVSHLIYFSFFVLGAIQMFGGSYKLTTNIVAALKLRRSMLQAFRKVASIISPLQEPCITSFSVCARLAGDPGDPQDILNFRMQKTPAFRMRRYRRGIPATWWCDVL